MELTLLKAKLHRACVTDACVDYEGSCAIDADLLSLSGIREYEQIHVYNVTNGERFTTYVIRAEAGSGIISMNGAAARKARVGDRVILCAYARMTAQEADRHKPAHVYLDERNKVTGARHHIPMQQADHGHLSPAAATRKAA